MPLGLFQTQAYFPGGKTLTKNISAATAGATAGPVVGAGTVFRIFPNTVGSAGSLTLNDLAVNTGAAAGNQIISIPFGSMTAGVPIVVEAPYANGIVISAITTGGNFSITST